MMNRASEPMHDDDDGRVFGGSLLNVAAPSYKVKIRCCISNVRSLKM